LNGQKETSSTPAVKQELQCQRLILVSILSVSDPSADLDSNEKINGEEGDEDRGSIFRDQNIDRDKDADADADDNNSDARDKAEKNANESEDAFSLALKKKEKKAK